MKRIAVVALIPCPFAQRQWLAVSRKDDHTHWGIPGGKSEEDEGALHTAMRETKEETGVNIEDAVFLCTNIVDDYVVHCYLVTKWHGVPTQQPGEGLVAWKTEAELGEGAFGAYNAARFAQVAKR